MEMWTAPELRGDFGKWEKGIGLQASLTCKDPLAPGFVPFDFPPDKVQRDRHVTVKSWGVVDDHYGSPAGASPSFFVKSDPGRISFTATMVGKDCDLQIDQLYRWMNPAGGKVGQALGAAAQVGYGALASRSRAVRAFGKGKILKGFAGKLPLLYFQYGTSITAVYLQNCTADYLRVDTIIGRPVKADVRLTLTIAHKQLPLTNPTSGGLPGRATHTVVEGDNLQSIATAGYGSPGRWRELAEANNIDDPLRVRPGEVVYLPNDDELEEKA